MAAEISEKLGITPELLKGDNGVFDVAAEGNLIYSKHREGRFPEQEKIIAALRKMQ